MYTYLEKYGEENSPHRRKDGRNGKVMPLRTPQGNCNKKHKLAGETE